MGVKTGCLISFIGGVLGAKFSQCSMVLIESCQFGGINFGINGIQGNKFIQSAIISPVIHSTHGSPWP